MIKYFNCEIDVSKNLDHFKKVFQREHQNQRSTLEGTRAASMKRTRVSLQLEVPLYMDLISIESHSDE